MFHHRQQASKNSVPGERLDDRVELFYDGECPICRREVAWLKKRRRSARIRFTDIADPDFSAERLSTTMKQLMAEIHTRLPDGRWVTGADALRQVYGELSYPWIVAGSRLPIISNLVDMGYRLFARNRLKLTGRCQPRPALCPVPVAKYESRA